MLKDSPLLSQENAEFQKVVKEQRLTQDLLKKVPALGCHELYYIFQGSYPVFKGSEVGIVWISQVV